RGARLVPAPPDGARRDPARLRARRRRHGGGSRGVDAQARRRGEGQRGSRAGTRRAARSRRFAALCRAASLLLLPLRDEDRMTRTGARRRVAIFGSTGSIGVQALDLAARLEDRFEIVALAAGSNADLLARQIRAHRPKLAAIADPSRRDALMSAAAETGCAVIPGEEGLRAVAEHPDADVVLAAIVGAAGLRPTWQALKAGRTVALANKESLVMAGALMRDTAAASGATLLPVDSEHSAVHQCLRGEQAGQVERILLTASGGPFRTRSLASLAQATPQEALRHPVWEMGRKISIDS